MWNTKLRVFFYQNPPKTQNQNFLPKFTFLGFLKILFSSQWILFPNRVAFLVVTRTVCLAIYRICLDVDTHYEVSLLIDNYPCSIDTSRHLSLKYRYFIVSILPITSLYMFVDVRFTLFTSRGWWKSWGWGQKTSKFSDLY